jgi:hypothetical protein
MLGLHNYSEVYSIWISPSSAVSEPSGSSYVVSGVLIAKEVAVVWDKGSWGTTMVDTQTFLDTLVEDSKTSDYCPQLLSMRISGVWASRLKKFYCLHTHMHKMDMHLLYYKRPGIWIVYAGMSFCFVVITKKPSHLQRHYPWKKERIKERKKTRKS